MDRSGDDVERVAMLHEPTRGRLYRYVAGRDVPVGRDEAAEVTGISRSLAAFHLDRLVRGGLLAVEYRRLSGRSGPGAGRPAKLYRRSGRSVRVSVPQTRYELMGTVLVRSIQASGGGAATARRDLAAMRAVAADRGRELAAELRPVAGTGAQLGRAERALEAIGFEPERRRGVVRLRNCPFDALVEEDTELVCALNRSLLTGVIAGLGCDRLVAEPDPDPAGCCVRVVEVGARGA